MSLLPENTPIVEVTKDDQYQICAFSRYHMRYENLMNRRDAIKQELQTLDSASTSLFDADGTALLCIGSGYYEDDATELDSALEPKKEALEHELETVEEELTGVRKTLDKLKVVLVGKFGGAINLNYERK